MTEFDECLINRLEHMFEKKKPVSKEEKELLETYKNDKGEFDFTKIKDRKKLFKMIDIFERFADEEAKKEFDKCHFPFDRNKFENEFKEMVNEFINFFEEKELPEKENDEEEFSIEIDDESDRDSIISTPKNAKDTFKELNKEAQTDTKKEIVNTINKLNEEELKKNRDNFKKEHKEVYDAGKCDGINPPTYELCENVHFCASSLREDPFFRKAVIKILSEIYFPNKKVVFEPNGFKIFDYSYLKRSNDIFVVLTNKWGKIRKDVIDELKSILLTSPVYIIDAQTLKLKRILNSSEFENYKMTEEQEDLELL